MGEVVTLPSGDGTMSVEIPHGWTLRGVLKSRARRPIDVARELRAGLSDPISAPSPLAQDYRGRSICIAVDDATRPTPVKLIFPTLLDSLLSSGAARQNVTVLVANGTHARMTDGAILERLGIAEAGGLRIVHHDCADDSALTDLGTTPSGLPLKVSSHVTAADFVISVGTIEPHIMAGFGGGYKNLVPGCAGLGTISATHLAGPASERFGNIGKFPGDCPVRRRIDEAARSAAPRCFIVNTVLDSGNNAVGLFCGEAGDAHRRGCELARGVWGAPLESKVDVLLGSSYPMTHDLCQASKAFSTGMDAVRPGGLAVLLLGCREGLGDYCVRPTSMSYEEVREIVRTGGTESYVETKRLEAGVQALPFYEAFLTQSNSEALRRADVFVYTPDIPYEIMKGFGLFKAFPTFEEMMSEAARLHPRADVAVSPSGGTCYPYFD